MDTASGIRDSNLDMRAAVLKENSMKRRKLGNSALAVSALGLGCMRMSFSCGPAKDKQKLSESFRRTPVGTESPQTGAWFRRNRNVKRSFPRHQNQSVTF
jgi:hypothetical protein